MEAGDGDGDDDGDGDNDGDGDGDDDGDVPTSSRASRISEMKFLLPTDSVDVDASKTTEAAFRNESLAKLNILKDEENN